MYARLPISEYLARTGFDPRLLDVSDDDGNQLARGEPGAVESQEAFAGERVHRFDRSLDGAAICVIRSVEQGQAALDSQDRRAVFVLPKAGRHEALARRHFVLRNDR